MTGRRGAAVAVLAVAVLVALGWALAGRDGQDDGGQRRAERPRAARTLEELRPDRIVARVEALRGLRLRERPRFRVRTPAQARRQLEAAEEREAGGVVSAEQERTDVAVAKLLGLLPADADLAELRGRVASEGTLGYYDGERNEMTIVAKGPTLPVGVETTVAHELTHAIDEQRFGILRRSERIRDADAALAYRSVLEGSASDVEERYRRRYRIPQADPADDAAARRLVRDLPFGLLLQLGFPYSVGASFVETLRAERNGMELLAGALGRDRPTSTVQILDPTRYFARARPRPVRLRARSVLGAGWTPLQDESVGAVDVLAVLSPTQGRSTLAAFPARAWRGGRFQLLRRRAARGETGPCPGACVARHAFVSSVVLADAGAARTFADQFGTVLTSHRRATVAAPGAWRVAGGGAAVRTVGDTATFAYAPTPELAQRLVRRAPAG